MSGSIEPTARGVPAESAGGFFRLVRLDAADAGRHPDLWDRMRSGELHGAIIDGVYDSSIIRTVVDRLERHDPPFLKTRFPAPFRSWFYGRNLNLAEPGLPGYFAEAATFNTQMQNLFPDGLAPDRHIAGILAALDGDRPFTAAPGPHAGERYMFATIRAHEEDGYIACHCDNELALRPSYRHLLGLVEPHIYSFVLTLAPGESGGALEVFDQRYDPLGNRLMSDDGSRPDFDLDHLPRAEFRLPAGSIILFDSGQYLHRVSPVQGTARRWTACSFMAMSRQRNAMYCWG